MKTRIWRRRGQSARTVCILMVEKAESERERAWPPLDYLEDGQEGVCVLDQPVQHRLARGASRQRRQVLRRHLIDGHNMTVIYRQQQPLQQAYVRTTPEAAGLPVAPPTSMVSLWLAGSTVTASWGPSPSTAPGSCSLTRSTCHVTDQPVTRVSHTQPPPAGGWTRQAALHGNLKLLLSDETARWMREGTTSGQTPICLLVWLLLTLSTVPSSTSPPPVPVR